MERQPSGADEQNERRGGMKQALRLLEQIISEAEKEDLEHKKRMVKIHKSSKAIGEGYIPYNLKILKELLIKHVESENDRPGQEKK